MLQVNLSVVRLIILALVVAQVTCIIMAISVSSWFKITATTTGTSTVDTQSSIYGFFELHGDMLNTIAGSVQIPSKMKNSAIIYLAFGLASAVFSVGASVIYLFDIIRPLSFAKIGFVVLEGATFAVQLVGLAGFAGLLGSALSGINTGTNGPTLNFITSFSTDSTGTTQASLGPGDAWILQVVSLSVFTTPIVIISILSFLNILPGFESSANVGNNSRPVASQQQYYGNEKELPMQPRAQASNSNM